MGLGKTFQTVASLWCLLTKGISGKPTCSKPLVLCPSSLVQNWGKELTHWLGQRVQPVVVDDTKAPAVKAALQVRGQTACRPAACGRFACMRVAAVARQHTEAGLLAALQAN
jgi:DNA repair and recombination RAD54-like protein